MSRSRRPNRPRRRKTREARAPSKPALVWWGRWDVWVGVGATIITGIALGIPPLLPRISVSYAGPQKYASYEVPTFTVTNDGVFGLNDIDAQCVFDRVLVQDQSAHIEDVVQIHHTRISRLEATQPFLVLCRVFGSKPIGGELHVRLRYRPDYSLFRSTVARGFESDGDFLHWTPPKLK
jgi:hypothetical protein